MKSIIKLTGIIVILTSLTITAQNHVPVVTNVTFAERTDGSFIVDIHYDVSDADNDTMTVTMQVSTDAGQTWNFSSSSIAGDVGSGIISGTGKHIVWAFGAEHPQFFSDQVKVKIEADDNVDSTVCPGIPTVTYGGKIYHTVQIGDQCWMKENLDIGTMITSSSGDQTDNGIIEKYCYDNYTSNCEIYGGLYQWDETMQYVTTEGAKGICPSGWHIPTIAEYQTLNNTVGGSGNALKSIGEGSGDGAGTNTSGFSALLGGYRYFNYGGDFLYLGAYTGFWSSTVYGSDAYEVSLHYNNNNVSFNYKIKGDGFSIRCIKN